MIEDGGILETEGKGGALGFSEIRTTRTAAQLGLAVGVIYLVQHLLFGGPAGPLAFGFYIGLFALLALASLLFLLRCRMQRIVPEGLTRAYIVFLVLWAACLTSMDLQRILDLSAYGVILVGVCAFLGAPLTFHVPLVLISCGLVLGSFVLSPFGGAFLDGAVPIIAYAAIGLGLASMRWSERRELFTAWKEIAERTARLEELSFKDPLTGLFNRRLFMESLDRAHSQALRSSSSFAVAIIDLDHFKRVNDSQGHAVGDLVLVEVAHLIGSSLRGSDFAARYGGEEFVLLLPATGLEAALLCVDRMRQKLETKSFRELSWPVTLSAGVAAFDGEETVDALLRRADRALYHAKAGGRNKVVSDGI